MRNNYYKDAVKLFYNMTPDESAFVSIHVRNALYEVVKRNRKKVSDQRIFKSKRAGKDYQVTRIV